MALRDKAFSHNIKMQKQKIKKLLNTPNSTATHFQNSFLQLTFILPAAAHGGHWRHFRSTLKKKSLDRLVIQISRIRRGRAPEHFKTTHSCGVSE